MGVKKSTVWTSARSSERRKTPASSAVSMPTIRFGFAGMSSPPSTWASTLGASLDAQPAHETISVRRIATSEERDEGRGMRDEGGKLRPCEPSLHPSFLTPHPCLSSYHEPRRRDDGAGFGV